MIWIRPPPSTSDEQVRYGPRITVQMIRSSGYNIFGQLFHQLTITLAEATFHQFGQRPSLAPFRYCIPPPNIGVGLRSARCLLSARYHPPARSSACSPPVAASQFPPWSRHSIQHPHSLSFFGHAVDGATVSTRKPHNKSGSRDRNWSHGFPASLC